MLNIDETVAAYRFPFLLAGNSIIFKSSSDYYKHFYNDLEEGLHHFHFTDSTLLEQIKWARTQDHNKAIFSLLYNSSPSEINSSQKKRLYFSYEQLSCNHSKLAISIAAFHNIKSSLINLKLFYSVLLAVVE